MKKRFGLIKRRPDLTRAAMQDYWRNTHGPLVANVENYWNYTDRYIQNHPLEIDTARVPIAEFDGVLETWTYEPLAETERAADEVLARFDARKVTT